MQISFPGPNGEILTVADSRQPIPTKPGKDPVIALPAERRPASFILSRFSR